MYGIVRSKKTRKKSKNKIITIDLSQGILFGVRNKSYKIGGDTISHLIIYHKKLAHSIAFKQVEKKYQKLLSIVPDLLVSDDESGESIREALNQIEKFRQIIKNKYRNYLKQKELEQMSKKLIILQRNAQERLMEIQKSNFLSKHSSYR